MDNDSVVEQIVRSLSFEVEAVPQDNIIQVNATSKSAPLNVKIRVRKKDEAGLQYGILSLRKPNKSDGIPERIRLVSSDQTIMSFNVVMEADFENTVRKPRKKIFGVFKQTLCLEAQPDEDKYAYLPSSTYKAETNEESTTSKSEGALKKFTLRKNEDRDETSVTNPKRNNDIFGKCRPGGCLDPPFGDDRHPYLPAMLNEQIKTPVHNPEVTEKTVVQIAKNKTRTSSILSHKLLNWKRKSNNDDALEKNVIKKETKAESILDLYQAGSLHTSTTYSNSIMTYPPTLNSSELRIQEEKRLASEIYNDSPKNSYNEPLGKYFTVRRMLKNVLDKNNTVHTLNIEDNSDIGDAKTDEVNTKSESKDKHKIAQSHDLVDVQKKHILQTKDSVTDVRGAERYLMESTHSKERSTFETECESISTTDLSPLKLHIPVFTKTERIELDDYLIEKSQEQDIRIKELTTSSTSVKISITDIPDVIERIPMCAAQNIDKVIEDRNKIITSNLIDKVQLPEEIEDKQEKQNLILFGKEQRPENIEDGGKNITEPKFKDEIENIWAPLRTETTNMFESPESTESENVDDDSDLKTEVSFRPRVKKTEDLITHSSIEEFNDASPTTEFQTNNKWPEAQNIMKTTNEHLKRTNSASMISVEESKIVDHSGSNAVLKPKYETKPADMLTQQNITTNKEITEQKFLLSEISRDILEITQQLDFKTYKETENLPPRQNYENNYDEKCVITLEAKQELKDEYKFTSNDLGDDGSSEIIISVKRDTPLGLIHTEGDDIQQIWENRDHSLERDTFIENNFIEKVFSHYKYNDILEEVIGQGTFNKTSNQIVENNIQKLKNENVLMINGKFEQDPKASIVLKNAQTNKDNYPKDSLSQSGNVDHTALLEGNIHEMFTQRNKNDSSAESCQEDTLDMTHLVSPLRETTELTRIKASSQNTITDDVKFVIESPFNYEYKELINKDIYDDSFIKLNTNYINEIDIKHFNKTNEESIENSLKQHVKKIEKDSINNNMQNIALQEPQPYKNKYLQLQNETCAKKPTDQMNEDNKADAKHITFNHKDNADEYLNSTVKCKSSNQESDFNLYSKAEPNIYPDLETKESKSLDINGFTKRFSEEHNSNQAQTPGVILNGKASFNVNLAIQSYLDESNVVIVKSFDTDKIQQRYPNDTVRVIKCSLEVNDEINIPIGFENNLSILIKSNKHKNVSEVIGHNLVTDITRENRTGIPCKNDVDPAKSNIIITDVIQRTLLAVYEEELLPLRNSISELKVHMEMLTSQHLLLKGHAFLKKPRSTRIVPLYRKCGCTRK